jgi:hypothetical protein
MTYSRKEIASWLDPYFDNVNSHQRDVESVAALRKYFSDDFDFCMYTSRNFSSKPLARDQLLILFIHPGLLEKLIPKYYVIDVDSQVVVVQFEIRFRDENSGKEWPPRQASAHYHLKPDGAGGIEIKKIQYWTETFTEEFDTMFEQWGRARDVALVEFGKKYLKTVSMD